MQVPMYTLKARATLATCLPEFQAMLYICGRPKVTSVCDQVNVTRQLSSNTTRSNCLKGLSNTMKDYCGLSEEFKNTCKVMREIERQHKDIEKRTYRSKHNEEERENHDENQDEIGEINYCQVNVQ
ncbi:unnamed protein product [Timema podura]|uniref:Uncharacterized protein n=1 Tax=Timema podura TaxID=61482 RepID=A0ABN7PDS6_TIMPD|nr:unnamed protein product [Timema podura]